MVLKPEVINAFKVFELDPASTTKEQAATAYKKLALKHHPDRNYGDSSANERFQQVRAFCSSSLAIMLIFLGVLSVNRLVQLGQYVSVILNILHRLRCQNLAPETVSKTSLLAGHIVPKMKYHWMISRHLSSSGMPLPIVVDVTCT
jgi:hypothetical protein